MAKSNGQFESGDKRVRHRGRPHFLNDPENVKLIAEAFAAGMSRDDMCELADVKDPGTITRWRKDPRIKAEVRKILNDRIMRISAKTDSVIEQRLQHAADMSIDDLIKIRKEFGGGAIARESIDEDGVMSDAMDALEKNPELLEQMRELITRSQAQEDEIVIPDDASELSKE